MQPAVLEANDLVVRRDGHEIVRVQRFAVRAGESHVLLGPNGAGKTTLLKALNCLEPAEGALLFEGRPVRRGADRLRLRRRTAAVFQEPFLLSTTVRGNVEAALRCRGLRGSELRRRADGALELLGIAHLAGRRRTGLSGGEAQRVSIARAVAVDPSVLFLDEPMASLDPPTRRSLMADLARIFQRLSAAVVWVTHDTEEALAVADRVTFLAEGRVVQEGTTSEVFNRPATGVVAEYLGVDVWLPGIVERDDSGTRFVLPGGASLMCADSEPGPAFACVHPDDVALFLDRPLGGQTSLRNIVPAVVNGRRAAGRSQLVTLRWAGGRLDALLTRAAAEELGLVEGQPVFAGVKATAIHVVPRAGAVGPGSSTEGSVP
jgi:tungstate transport system ATP-binding protein